MLIKLLQLFFSFMQVGLFSIGGGYAALPLIQNQVVDIHGWITLTEFTDLITIAEMTPGPISINSSTFVGMRVLDDYGTGAGILGAVVATFGSIFPSFVIVSVLAYVYFKYRDLTAMSGLFKGLRPVIIALIASAGLSILILTFTGVKDLLDPPGLDINYIGVALFGAALFFQVKFKKNPIYTMLGSGIIGGLIYLLTG